MLGKHIVFLAAMSFGAPIVLAGTANAAVYNAFNQYSIKANPNGPWSYRAAGQLLSLSHEKCNSIKKDYCWTNNNDGYPTEAADEANKSKATAHYLDVVLPASYLDFDPEQTSDIEFVWTAPAAGAAVISGNFLGVATDEGAHNVSVLHNGTVLATYTMTSYQQKETFKLKAKVAAGDTITFISYTGNNGDSLSTGLQARIVVQ